MSALRDMDVATMSVAVLVGVLLVLAGCLAGAAVTSWWHERRQPRRAWRCQIARDLHGDAKFEPDRRAQS